MQTLLSLLSCHLLLFQNECLNPVEALIFFFRLLLSNCLNWKFTAMITLHFHLQRQCKYKLFHINFTSFHCTGRYELNKLTSLPMCGFIAQLVEHRTGIAEVTGSNPVEALIFFRLLLSNCLNRKFTGMITLHFHAMYTFVIARVLNSLITGRIEHRYYNSTDQSERAKHLDIETVTSHKLLMPRGKPGFYILMVKENKLCLSFCVSKEKIVFSVFLSSYRTLGEVWENSKKL